MRWLVFGLIVLSSLRGTCQESLVRELVDRGDGFRALTLMIQQEHANRGVRQGRLAFERILALHVLQKDYPGAVVYLDSLGGHYLPQTERQSWRSHLEYLSGKLTADAHLGEVVWERSKQFCQEAECEGVKQIWTRWQQSHQPKNLWVAGILGIVPGAGQIYSGYWPSGIASFLGNAVLLGLTTVAVQRREYGFAAGVGTLAAMTYGGSIYAGIEAARRTNRLGVQKLDTSLREYSWSFPVLQLKF